MTKSLGIRERHGMSNTKIYRVWSAMLSRCLNPKSTAYANYGGRGISVCSEWRKFSTFYRDMGDAPLHHTLDRVDNSKGYDPKNCRWASRTIQSRNKRDNILITIDGETLTLSGWADRVGIRYATIHQRIRIGWPAEDAIKTPLVTKRLGVPRGKRIYAHGAEKDVVWTEPAEERAA